MHTTCCFDLDAFFDALKGHKPLGLFPLCTMDARLNAGVFDSVRVTLFIMGMIVFKIFSLILMHGAHYLFKDWISFLLKSIFQDQHKLVPFWGLYFDVPNMKAVESGDYSRSERLNMNLSELFWLTFNLGNCESRDQMCCWKIHFYLPQFIAQ